jgi:hypothetical protein
MLEVQNNLMWLPTVTNVPALLAMRVVTRASTTRAGAPSTYADNGPGGANVGGGSTLGAAVGATARRDPGAQVRNPNLDSRFVGNTPFVRMVRSRSVALVIAPAGYDPPQVVRNGVTWQHCISWHARGQCFEFCQRAADHAPLEPAEAAAFHAWTDAAFARNVGRRQTPSLAAEPVPLERTHSTAPVVKTSIKSFNKALGESTFSLLANHSHRRGSKNPSPENVKQALSSLCAESFEALPPPSVMVRPTEASPSVLSPPESTNTPPVPTEAPSNAIPVEIMAEFLAKETAPAPVEALSNAKPVAALPSSLRAEPVAALHSSLRAVAPAW